MSIHLRPSIRDSAPNRPSRSSEEHATVTELPLDALSDAALVSALLRGNERAAAVIWHRHSPAVRRMLRRSLGPDQEIEDLVQDVFIGFIKGARQLEDASTLRSYLVAIAFRVAAMEIRRRKVRRWVTLTPHGEIPETASSSEPHDERWALRALYQILDTLPARDRLIFVARHVEGLQIEQTAAALGLSTATVWRVGKSSLDGVLVKARKDPALADYVERRLKGSQP
jgi:RNA polymerase sigma-70 factor, ECF subfamily